MHKHLFHSVLVLLLMVFISCEKGEISESDKLNTAAITNKTSNISLGAAVTAKQLGAKGNGVDDDTEVLQSIINSRDEVILDGGTYLISKTLQLRPSVKIIGLNYATIKSGNNMSGTLLSRGMYLSIQNAQNCSVSGLKFKAGNVLPAPGGWADACIYIYNSANTLIENNTFDFASSVGIIRIDGIWVSGPNTVNTVIRNNRLNYVGIKYAENGASNTTVENNIISNAFSNALTANGNSSSMIKGCKLLNNSIYDAGRMGIEDWGLVDGTIIRGNSITGTGKRGEYAHEGMGISAVGTNTRVVKNKIWDAKVYYIEMGGNHNIVADSNDIRDPSQAATGIILNYTDKMPSYLSSSYSQVLNNTFRGCLKAVHVFGAYEALCAINGNTFTDHGSRGICIESDARTFQISVQSNKFFLTQSTAVPRLVINSYTNVPCGTGNQSLTVDKNYVYYYSTAGGGKGFDSSFIILTDHAKVTNNEIAGNNIKTGGYPVYAISSNGGRVIDAVFRNNKVTGAVVDMKGYDNTSLVGNIFSDLRNFLSY